MTLAPLHLLAASDTDFSGIAFAIVFILIWAAGAATNVMKRKAEQQKRDQLRRDLNDGSTSSSTIAPPPVVATPAAKKITRQPRREPRQRPAQQRAAPQRDPVSNLPPALAELLRRTMQLPSQPAPIKAPAATAPIPPPAPIARAPIPPAPVPAASLQPVQASNLRSWLRPEKLRREFILTEILQPPLALRNDDRNQ